MEIKSTNKYLVKRKYKTINGTAYPMDEYLVILYEEDSEDCGFIRPQYQWSATTGYLCDDETYTKYTREVYMVSYDSGVTWAVVEPVQERRGEVIEYDSYDCGRPMYRCVETMETGCIIGDVKVAFYDTNNTMMEYVDCDSTQEINNGEYSVTKSLVKKIEIGDCITTIGNSAFTSFPNATELVIPNTITTIGNRAFYACEALTSVTMPNSLITIRSEAFRKCYSLSSITIPDSVTTIGASAFTSCSNLSACTLGSGVTQIAEYAFSGCTRLTNVNMSNNVQYIHNYAFDSCNFENINLSSSLIYISNRAFRWCRSLTSITIPDSVTAIHDGVFYECTGLTEINFGSSLRSIGEEAFRNCHGITSIILPSSLQSIGKIAFYGCDNLTSVTVNATTPPTIGERIFYGANVGAIYVPAQSVDAYKSAWSSYASLIQAITT